MIQTLFFSLLCFLISVRRMGRSLVNNVPVPKNTWAPMLFSTFSRFKISLALPRWFLMDAIELCTYSRIPSTLEQDSEPVPAMTIRRLGCSCSDRRGARAAMVVGGVVALSFGVVILKVAWLGVGIVASTRTTVVAPGWTVPGSLVGDILLLDTDRDLGSAPCTGELEVKGAA